MKILVYGAGALGLFLAGHLSKNHNVLAITRKKFEEDIAKNGLRIIGDRDERFFFNIDDNLNDKHFDCDIIIIALKSFDIKNAIETLSKYYKHIPIITIQNGIYAEDIATNVFGKKYIFPAVVMIGVNVLDNNTIYKFLDGDIKLGFLDEDSKDVSYAICDSLSKSGIKCSLSNNIMKDKWIKFMFYCAGGTLNSLTGTKNLEDKYIKWVVNEVLKEIRDVGSKMDLQFNINEVYKETFNFLMSFKPESWNASIGFDLKNGKGKTEIDFLNGYIVQLAKKLNINVPVNKTLYMLIKTLEQTNYLYRDHKAS